MFSPPFLQFNGHLQTILPSFFRKIIIQPLRERLNLPDGDFLLLDWVKNQNERLVIVTHGLEGDSKRHYVQGIIQKFLPFGFDGLAWNCRSCGGEINNLPRFYHHGDASDLKYLIDSILERQQYKQIFLVGFSMGGSLTLRVLAENQLIYKNHIMAAAVASVPLDLVSSVAELEKKGKRFYMNRFIKKLKKKIEIKERMFPYHPILKTKHFERIKDFRDFDNIFTAPLHGYLNADDFYSKASVKPLLSQIKVPSMIMQAINDPFLTPECLDLGIAHENKELNLFLTPIGGHVGFMQKKSKSTFFEEKALEFCLLHDKAII